MTELFDSGGLRVVGYVVAAAGALLAGRREWAARRTDRNLWPMFWFLSAAVLVIMGTARAVEIADLISDLGRASAKSGGWYEVRRGIQAAVVAAVFGTWAISVLVAIWRVPERRRRYLPAAIALSAIVCFAVVRSISLHHIDALLDRTDLGGVRLRAWGELGLLTLMVVTTAWFPFARASSGSERRTHEDDDPDQQEGRARSDAQHPFG